MCEGSEILPKDLETNMALDAKNIAPLKNASSGKQFVLFFHGALPTLEEATKRYIEFAVSYNSGAKDRTAIEIGIDRKTLYKRLHQEEVMQESN